MKRLLSKENWRGLMLVEQLYGKGWVVSDTMTEVIKCSERTLRSDVQRINQVIKPVRIETSLKTGLRLKIPASHSMKHIYAILLRDSPNFIILERLFFSDYDSLGDLARDVYQSLASLNRSIRQINAITSSSGFVISTKPPIKIEGNEHEILAFFRSYFFERYSDEFPFDKANFQSVLAVLNQFYDRNNQFIFIINFTMLALYVFIKAIRLQQSSEPSLQTSNAPSSPAVKKLNQQLSHLTGLAYPYHFFSDDWGQINEDIYFCSYHNFQKGIHRFPAVRAEYERLTELTCLLDASLFTGIENQEIFIFRLYSFNLSEQLVRPILFNYPEEMLENIATHTPYFYKKIEAALVKYIRKNPDFEMETLLYNVMSSFDNFTDISRANQPRFRIGLWTNYNGLLATKNKELIEDAFGDRVRVMMLNNSGHQKPIDKLDYDLIVTDISELQVAGIKTLAIAYDITEREIQLIKNRYDEFLKEKANELFDY